MWSTVITLFFSVILVALSLTVLVEFQSVPGIDNFRMQAIYALQNDAERLEVSNLKDANKLLSTENAQLSNQVKEQKNQIARLDNLVMAQKYQIDNALVIEKDIGEIYERRVKPKVVAAGEAVKDAFVSVKMAVMNVGSNE